MVKHQVPLGAQMWGASRATQFPAVSTVDESFVRNQQNPPLSAVTHCLKSAYSTPVRFVSKRSFEFRHETAGEVEDAKRRRCFIVEVCRNK
jgi:hypothetical protein